MGKKGKWFSSIKKALSPVSSSKKHQTSVVADPVRETYVEVEPHPPSEEIDVNERSSSVIHENATDHREVAVEDEVTLLEISNVSATRYGGKSLEEVAAIKIQTMFRGYLARRGLRALRGLVRLNLLVQGSVVKRQATNTLKCMQTLARVQSQIRSRRVRMSEENEALQRQLLQKHVKELGKVQMSDEWNDSARSKEEVESKIVNKHEAAMRRERALAYAFTHQQTWKNTAKTPNTMFMNPTNPSWGWSWLERLMSAKPWEHEEKELSLLNDQSSIKNATRTIGGGGEINKSYALHQLNLNKPSPTSSPRTSSINNKPILRKTTSTSSKITTNPEDEKINRRHSYAGSSIKDDVVSLISSPSLPSYMVPTQSAKAKLRVLSPLGLESSVTTEVENVASGGLLKKRVAYPASPAKARRHSGPPKMESHTIVEQASVIGVES